VKSQSAVNDDDDDDTTSLSESETQEKVENLPSSSSSSPSSTGELQTIYSNKTFVTCRSPGDSFFLCQVLQDVFSDTKKFRIRWCSRIDGKADEDAIDENTHFILDYEDTLDPQTILTSIPSVIRYPDRSISLKSQDIFETKRLLEKSIKGETTSPEEPMETSVESTKKPPTVQLADNDIYDDENDNVQLAPPKIIPKRKVQTETTKKQQPPQKRARKTSGEPARLKRQVTLDINEIEEHKEPTPKKAGL